MNQTFSYGLLKMGKVLEMIKSNPFFGKETEPESSGPDMQKLVENCSSVTCQEAILKPDITSYLNYSGLYLEITIP